MVIIRQARLSLLARLAAKRPTCILSILGAIWDKDVGWVSAVRGDLLWFSCASYFADPLFVSVPHAFESISASPCGFVRAVKKFSATKFANFDVPMAIPSVAPQCFRIPFVSSAARLFRLIRNLPSTGRLSTGTETQSTPSLTRFSVPFVCCFSMTGFVYSTI